MKRLLILLNTYLKTAGLVNFHGILMWIRKELLNQNQNKFSYYFRQHFASNSTLPCVSTGEQSRYFDLIRWGIAKQTINTKRVAEPGDGRALFQDKNFLFPIPDAEKNYNLNVASDIANSWN